MLDFVWDIWAYHWTRSLARDIALCASCTHNLKPPVYPPMIESWFDGYISEISFYTSGFL